MKIYLASRYGRILEMADYAKTLQSLGHEITSTWVWGNEEGKTQNDIAVMDYEDVIRAECILNFTEEDDAPIKGGGRHVEFGIGYHEGLWCCIVGRREVIFHWLPKVEQFETFDEFVSRIH